MKIQYIAVIFIVIILPISMVMFSYIGSQMDTITLQTEYNTKLTSSTYDAIKALQINTVNNRYSSISDSKIRDIEAAISTFYNSLSNNEQLSQEELRDFVPALVFTLYDGYYIYSKYDNVYPINNGQPILDEETLKQSDGNYGLKPYIYYSCRYQDGTRNFVVNYTLDNAITIYGTFGTEYKTLSGYFINPDAVEVDRNYNSSNPETWILTYNGVEIGPEILTEHLLFNNEEQKDYDYLVYDGQKIYYDPEQENNTQQGNAQTAYFLYQDYSRVYLTDSYANREIMAYLRARTGNSDDKFNNDGRLHSTSSFEYYYEARQFSQEVDDLLGGITQTHAVDESGNPMTTVDEEGNVITTFSVNTEDQPIFEASNDNDPLISGSTFDENRMAVIRKSIETNLVSAIANYNLYTGTNYEFSLPALSDVEWEKITNNVTMISFLQGIPIGHKYYNNYCVITSDNNEEVIKKENIYIVTENASGQREYHMPGCTYLMQPETTTGLKIVDAYSNLSFIRQTVRIAEGDYWYFYPQTRYTTNNELVTITSCYHCIVNAANVYDVNKIMEGKVYTKNAQWEDELTYDIDKAGTEHDRLREIRNIYLRALGRERYDLYQVNIDAFNT